VVWIYDLEIFERFRRKGYAKRTLEAAEREAKELGIDQMELHVFGHNAPARALYEKAGYAPTSIVMAKQLSGEED
jgi:ribosomal protein S18 acetylase RimI-like enzyme